MEPGTKRYFAHIPTIALFVIFAMSPWIGILLYILRSIEREAEKKEREQSDYTADFRAQDMRAEARATADEDYLYGHDAPTEEQKKAKKRQKTITGLCTVLGAIFLLAGVLSIGNFSGGFGEVFSALGKIVGGGGALFLSLRMKSTRKLERQLDKIVGYRDNMPLDELFAAAGVSAAQGRPALEKAIDHGYFGASAYIDNRTNILVVRGDAPEPPPKPEPPEPPVPPAPEDRYTGFLRQLRQANDAVADPVMSAKIARLEQVSARIFRQVQENPGKEPQLKKFMDYYLPTALKLLNAYVQFSAQDVQGKNITEAKASIERSMDLLVTAFENQLDKLYQADALDVTGDIAALEGMLNLDGLTKGDFESQPSQSSPPKE